MILLCNSGPLHALTIICITVITCLAITNAHRWFIK